MVRDGLRRSNFRVKDIDVSGTATGNISNPVMTKGNTWYVDGSLAVAGDGTTWSEAFATIQEGVTAASAGDTVYVVAKTLTDYTGDPTSYAETIIIPYATSSLALIGVSRGRTQGGLPQVKKGSGSTALLTIRAPGCLIANMGFNGVSATGGGILLDDDYSTKSAFGTTITNCHIKNCVGSTATSAKTGGGIMWTTAGNAWQVSILGCTFYKNVGDIVLMGTTNTRPQDILIQDCIFKSSVTSSCDANIVDATQGGFQQITIDNCKFGDLPALGSGAVLRYIDLTGTQQGTLSNCTFGCQTNETGGTVLTFKAAGTAGLIPTTVHIINCFGQTIDYAESGEIAIE